MATKKDEPTRGQLTARVCGRIGGIPRVLGRMLAELEDLRTRCVYITKHKGDSPEITAAHVAQVKTMIDAAEEIRAMVEGLQSVADIIDEDVNRLAGK